jgi:hypothetical protein
LFCELHASRDFLDRERGQGVFTDTAFIDEENHSIGEVAFVVNNNSMSGNVPAIVESSDLSNCDLHNPSPSPVTTTVLSLTGGNYSTNVGLLQFPPEAVQWTFTAAVPEPTFLVIVLLFGFVSVFLYFRSRIRVRAYRI